MNDSHEKIEKSFKVEDVQQANKVLETVWFRKREFHDFLGRGKTIVICSPNFSVIYHEKYEVRKNIEFDSLFPCRFASKNFVKRNGTRVEVIYQSQEAQDFKHFIEINNDKTFFKYLYSIHIDTGIPLMKISGEEKILGKAFLPYKEYNSPNIRTGKLRN